MKITQLDKSIETIKKLEISEYCKVYFLILKTSKTKKGTDNYVFNSKRLDYLQFNEINIYMDNPNYMLVKIEAATAENDNKSDADNGIKRKTVGVGIGNIAYRIKGMYNNSGIKIYSVKERGTVIQIFFDNYSK